jgi:hypothetical protein
MAKTNMCMNHAMRTISSSKKLHRKSPIGINTGSTFSNASCQGKCPVQKMETVCSGCTGQRRGGHGRGCCGREAIKDGDKYHNGVDTISDMRHDFWQMKNGANSDLGVYRKYERLEGGLIIETAKARICIVLLLLSLMSLLRITPASTMGQ